jgi:hypothetical protein
VPTETFFMPIDFTCKCGKQLRAKDTEAGKRVQCPACGRALVAPDLAPTSRAPADWQIDPSEQAADRAQSAGVLRRGRASVIHLRSKNALQHDLAVAGVVACWHCRSDLPFTGRVFGRIGLGGSLLAMTCPKCHAKVWLGYSSHGAAEGTDLYLYAPSRTRDSAFADEEDQPAPAFRVEKVEDAPDTGKAERGLLNNMLPRLMQAVSHQEAYQEVNTIAAKLVGLHLAPSQMESVCRSLRSLLEKENNSYLLAILTEALACLRDEEAAQAVRGALQRALAKEDPSDQTNLPMHDLCMLALLYGDGNGFLQALNQGLKKLTITTRACRLGQHLNPNEVWQLILDGRVFDSYESTLGGTNWLQIQPLLPLWIDEEAVRHADPRKNTWLNRFFGQRVGKKST